MRTLLGPGPSPVHPRVLAALSRPTLGHLDPAFVAMMDETKALLQYAFQTRNPVTVPVSGPASAAMECCFANLVEAGDEVVVCRNGAFGDRMRQIVERLGGRPVVVDDAWGAPVDPHKLEDALKAHPRARLVAFVHAETSTGALSDAQTLARLAHDHDRMVLADTVTSLGGVPVRVDEWGLDAAYSGSQKCLSCPPGLAPLSFGERALAKLKARTNPVPVWFFDLNLVMTYWGGGKRAYHHTAPVNALYGLHEALVMLAEEGLEQSWTRHARHDRAFRAGLEALDLALLVDEPYRLPQLSIVRVPEGVDEARVRTRLLEEFGIEIGAGLGALAGKVWRIGLMGFGCNAKNVMYCLGALESVLAGERRGRAASGAAVRAAEGALR